MQGPCNERPVIQLHHEIVPEAQMTLHIGGVLAASFQVPESSCMQLEAW